ncbi:MAG: YMGG-like glycine zipper-containing protein [Halioglobus sp.]
MHTNLNSVTSRRVKRSASRVVALIALASLCISGCAMNQTQQRTGTGAAIGALGGAMIGTSRESAAIGAAVGAAGGFLFDQFHQREDAQSENAQLRAENERLRKEAGNQ